MIGTKKPTHPGEVLWEDVIKPLGLTVTEAAKRLGVTRNSICGHKLSSIRESRDGCKSGIGYENFS